ncbi:Uncharacterised protein [Chlamydia trachomatis]|nr:Uncharacterised protein [Chlamydia trachomatis]
MPICLLLHALLNAQYAVSLEQLPRTASKASKAHATSSIAQYAVSLEQLPRTASKASKAHATSSIAQYALGLPRLKADSSIISSCTSAAV